MLKIGRLAAFALAAAVAACSPGASATGSGHSAPPAAAPAATATPVPTPTPLPALSLQELFHPGYQVPDDSAHVRTLLVTGDVIPAREVNVQASRRGDFLWPFRQTADYTKNADITYINLESPLFSGCQLTSEGFSFCGDARFADGLTFMGAKVANLANNHLGNYGPEGTRATVQLLEGKSIKTSGLGPPAVIEVRGLKFAFIGFNGVGLAVDRNALKAGIENARTLADVVVVQFHWGKEYERQPLPDPGVPTPDDPVALGHLSIDWGADIVIGNHPHWYQGVEVYKGKLITYAHGNFVFDQMWSDETELGVVGTYTFYDNKLVKASWKPLRIYDYGQPRWLEGDPAAAILATMEDASKQLATRLGEPTS